MLRGIADDTFGTSREWSIFSRAINIPFVCIIHVPISYNTTSADGESTCSIRCHCSIGSRVTGLDVNYAIWSKFVLECIHDVCVVKRHEWVVRAMRTNDEE